MIDILLKLYSLVILLTGISVFHYKFCWAMFYRESEMPTETLKGKHNDWWWFLHWVPRRLTAFLNTSDSKYHYPKQLFGTNKREFLPGILECDVPGIGTWSLSWPPHFSLLTNKGTLIRIGLFRKDYWDPPSGGYWTFLAAAWHGNE